MLTRKTPGNTDWFTKARFGMFIHWGLYSMPARHEWIKHYECISDEKYDKYFKYFDPDMYNPKEWAENAKKAGMKYVVVTTKHHEGFCMFDSKYTDYKCTNTPAGRDLIKELVEAFREQDIKIGFYYSLIDWHHADFTIDNIHPRRNEQGRDEINKNKDMKVYAEYMRNQVTELLTNYGKIDILWFDFSYPDSNGNNGKGKNDWESEKLIATVRKLQPEIIINNRADIEQDLWTPEQYQPNEWLRHPETNEPVVWEACQTFSGSWGYHREEKTWKSPEQLIRMLINTVSLGGNLLMNVGPTSRGYFDERAIKALSVYEDWMKYNSRSIYNCTMADPIFMTPSDCRLTQNKNRLYIHIYAYPYISLLMKGLAGKIDYAQFLHDGSEILFDENIDSDVVNFKLPVDKPNIIVPVIEVFLK